MPAILWWARRQERFIIRCGRKLDQLELSWCKQLGIQYPERIRILTVPKVPTPSPAWLEQIIRKLNFPAGNAAGMCLRYGIFIHDQVEQPKTIIAHELVHTKQYEQLGGFAPFMKQYILECIQLGYANSPMEHDANSRANKLLHIA